MSRGLSLRENEEWEVSDTEPHREVSSQRQCRPRSAEAACPSSSSVFTVGERGQEGLDFHQMLPETAGRSRRDPLLALLGNSGLTVCPRAPRTGARSSARYSASCLIAKERGPTQ